MSVLEQAMALPENERRELAYKLLESVGEEFDADEELDDEIDRRITEIDSGKVKGLSCDEMREKLKAKYKWPS